MKIQVYKGGDCQGTLDYEGLGQFLVNVLDRALFGDGEGFLSFIRDGLKLERQNYHEEKSKGWIDEDDRMMTKRHIAKALRRAAWLLEQEIKRDRR